MNTDDKPVKDISQRYWDTYNESRIENGHLRWSSWTQRRLMHIGVPIAGFFAMIVPFALYTASGTGIMALSSNTPNSNLGVSQNNDDTTIDQVYSSISSQPENSSSANNTHTTSLIVNGQTISVPENATKTTKINDVSGTTSVYTASTSTQTTHGSESENNSSLRIDINHNRSP